MKATSTHVVRRFALLAGLASLGVTPSFGQDETLRLDLGSGVSLELARIRAGTFEQGSRAGEPDRADDESPRTVTLSKDFYIGRYEVTVGQFRRFVEESGYRTEAEKGTSGGFGWTGQGLVQRQDFNWRNPGYPQTDAHPVTIVTFDDAMAFTRWVSGKSGRAVSLPTEAQWEFAARSGSTSAYPAGSARATQPPDLGWFKTNAGTGAQPVGQKLPNGAGLFDLGGNAAEWCLDWYGPYEPGPVTDPVEMRSNLGDKPRRVLRGGSWLRDPRNGRLAARYRSTPGSRNADNGFRVVVGTQPPAPDAVSANGTDVNPPARSDDATRPSSTPGFGILGGLFALAAGGLWVLWRFVRRLAGGDRPHGVATKIGPDGFSLRARQVPMGHKIQYRYVVDGVTKTGTAIATGDAESDLAIYTGGRPSSVQVLSVLAPGERAAVVPERPVREARVQDRNERSRNNRTDDDSVFRNYPSAY